MPARPTHPRISRYGFLQPDADSERQENRRVRHEVKQTLARVHDAEDALDAGALPAPRHTAHSEHVEATEAERNPPNRRWKARHWRQKMWKKDRRRRWKQDQHALAGDFWSDAGHDAT